MNDKPMKRCNNPPAFFNLILYLRDLSHPYIALDDVIILLQELNF